MRRYLADFILPVSGPLIRHGWVAADAGRVVAVGSQAMLESSDSDDQLGRVVVMPGLVNAHTHLELSYLRDEVPPAPSFVSWIRSVIAARRTQPDPSSPAIAAGVMSGIDEAVRTGTALVGDISNTLVTFEALDRSSLAGVVFYELLGFNVDDPVGFVTDACRRLENLTSTSRVRPGLAAHAPYSVAPTLFREIRRAAERDPLTPYSVHLSESAEEVEFVQSAEGPWRQLLEELGVWSPSWTAPGVSPVEYLEQNGFLGPRTLAVHGVQMSPHDLSRLAMHGTTLVTCPRSNGHTGAGAPPLEDFYASGVSVAIGTDSLASAPDLNVFSELATLRALAPSLPAHALLDSATRQGARALGFEADYGTIEPGKRARLLAVTVPADVEDVEEYLVSGILPEQVRWLEP